MDGQQSDLIKAPFFLKTLTKPNPKKKQSYVYKIIITESQVPQPFLFNFEIPQKGRIEIRIIKQLVNIIHLTLFY